MHFSQPLIFLGLSILVLASPYPPPKPSEPVYEEPAEPTTTPCTKGKHLYPTPASKHEQYEEYPEWNEAPDYPSPSKPTWEYEGPKHNDNAPEPPTYEEAPTLTRTTKYGRPTKVYETPTYESTPDSYHEFEYEGLENLEKQGEEEYDAGHGEKYEEAEHEYYHSLY